MPRSLEAGSRKRKASRSASRRPKVRDGASKLPSRSHVMAVTSEPVGRLRHAYHTLTISRTTRNLWNGTWTANVADTGGAQTTNQFIFTLDQLPNYSEFTKLFQEYRIAAVKVTFMPLTPVNIAYQSGGYDTSVGFRVPQLGFCADYTGKPVPDTGNEQPWLECEGYEQHTFNKPVSVTFKPTPLAQQYESSTTTGYGIPSKAPWLAVSDANVPHYSLNARLYDPYFNHIEGADNTPNLAVYITYTVQLRGAT